MVTKLGVDSIGARAIGPGLKVKRDGLFVPHPPADSGSGAPSSIPTYRGHDAQNSPGATQVNAGFAQDGDYLLAIATLTGVPSSTGPNGSGWTLLGTSYDASGNGGLTKVWGKFWHTGDQTLYDFNRAGEGLVTIIGYSNVVGVHANVTEGQANTYGNPVLVPTPAGWDSVGMGSRALLITRFEDSGDWPIHPGADGWRRDADLRRWDRGGAVYSTVDPAVWSADARLFSQYWVTPVAVLLLGAENIAGTWADIPSTTRPTWIAGGGYGWDQPVTMPVGALVGDLWIVDIGANGFGELRYGKGHEQGERGWWQLAGYNPAFACYSVARFITEDDAGVGSESAVQPFGTASRGYSLIRGVDPLCPLRRTIERQNGNTVAFADVTTGINTMLLAVAGSNAHTAYTLGGFDAQDTHVRWNPMGSLARKVVTDGEVVSGLSLHDNEGQSIASVLFELRGAA